MFLQVKLKRNCTSWFN